MKRFYIIESMKKNKNGHVSHLMVEKEDGVLYEVSPRTGKLLSKQDYWRLEDYLKIWNYKVVNSKEAMFTGALFFPFFDYLKENNLIIEEVK